MKKLLIILFLIGCAGMVSAQVTTMKSTFDLSSDTVTNTGTVWLQATNVKGSGDANVQVVCTKISGTVAGTLTLQGSLDGINFVALTDTTSVPAIPTKTATDVASQTFLWRVTNHPCVAYRVSWTGSGTMAASFTASLLNKK